MNKPDYATDKQWTIYQMSLDGLKVREIARKLGVDHSVVSRSLKVLKQKKEEAEKQVTVAEQFSLRTHMFIPDCQVHDGTPTDHLDWIGKYMLEYRPDVIVNAGDFADMPSLSSYDKGKKQFEGRRYNIDIKAARDAMEILLRPMKDHNMKLKDIYNPEMHLTVGNHEARITRAVEEDAILEDMMSISNLRYEEDWIVHDFLTPVEIDGILYCHYFCRSANGKVMQNRRGAPNAATQVKREMQSCTAGHAQGLDWHPQQTQSTRFYGLIAGSCYLHEEQYLGVQGTAYWRGIVIKHEVEEGRYDPMFVSLDFLCRKYEKMRLSTFMAEKYGS